MNDPPAIRATFEKMKGYRGPRFGAGRLLQNPADSDFSTIDNARQASLARLYGLTLDGTPIAGVLGL